MSTRTPRWGDAGLCTQVDGSIWFPEDGGLSLETRAAIATCGRCPIRWACGEYALRTRQEYGIWAGMTEPVRRSLLKRISDGEALTDVLADYLYPVEIEVGEAA